MSISLLQCQSMPSTTFQWICHVSKPKLCLNIANSTRPFHTSRKGSPEAFINAMDLDARCGWRCHKSNHFWQYQEVYMHMYVYQFQYFYQYIKTWIYLYITYNYYFMSFMDNWFMRWDQLKDLPKSLYSYWFHSRLQWESELNSQWVSAWLTVGHGVMRFHGSWAQVIALLFSMVQDDCDDCGRVVGLQCQR